MPDILIVEDHLNLRLSLKECLEKEGYRIQIAEDLKTAREQIKSTPDLIILDWMLPDGQGLDLLTAMRRQGNTVPVILLTAKAELVDKVIGLEMGASDYMTKPFEPRELLARVRARLREASPASPAHRVLEVGALSVDLVRRAVRLNGSDIDLVKKEFDLLVLFAEAPEKVFSREEILNKVWGYDVFPTTRTVDTHVMLLRQKIHADLIETVRAVGYRLRRL